MKKTAAFSTIILSVGLSFVVPAQARNVEYMVPIAKIMESKEAQEKLDGSVKFYFADQKHPSILNKTRKATAKYKATIFENVENADALACKNAFITTLLKLQEKAKSAGANAVVNIASYYKRNDLTRSSTEFECHAGRYWAIVTLTGEVAKVSEQ